MIIDKLENWSHYFSGDIWKLVYDYLNTLSPDTSEGEHFLLGKEVFARVMSYETVDYDKAVLEAHREYIDIQSVIVGGEGIAWHPTGDIPILSAYDLEKDVEFFQTPNIFPARTDVYPGFFAALFPHDAHMPQLRVVGMPPRVKKVVVKVHRSLYPIAFQFQR